MRSDPVSPLPSPAPVRVGTISQNLPTPPIKWLLAIHQKTQSKNSTSKREEKSSRAALPGGHGDNRGGDVVPVE